MIFCSIPQKMDATSPLRLSAVYPLSCQWLMHHDQLCQTVAPLQPRNRETQSALSCGHTLPCVRGSSQQLQILEKPS
ncbi:hypothetical protein CDH54_00040 [Escherichia coli]|nr:hypothetical protein CDH54_00040 [Escherichia coli]